MVGVLAWTRAARQGLHGDGNVSLGTSAAMMPAGAGTTHHCPAFRRLDNNQFQDPVMDLLGSVLSGKDCRIQRIR